MTEAEWTGCTDLYQMLEFLRDKASDRKLRLFSVACHRRLWHRFEDERTRRAIHPKQKAQINMKTWTPLIIAVVLALLINAVPIFMAFVVRAEAWLEAGWAYYFLTIPIALVLVLLGLVVSLVLFFRRKST